MLGALALARVSDLIAARVQTRRAHGRRFRARTAGAVLAGLTVLVLVQPLAADVRSAQVLGRDDTRQQARDWLEANYPPELRAAVEPAVPGRWFRSNPEGDPPSWLSRCARRDGWTEPGWSYVADRGRRICAQYKPGLVARPDGGVRASAYHSVLGPEVIDDYRLYGYCLVMTVDVVRDRALQTGDPDARALLRAPRATSRACCASSAPTTPAPTRCPSTSTSPTTTTRPSTTARARRCGSTGSTTASRPPGRR